VELWERVDQLIDRAPTITDLHAHRLHLYAEWRWRELGRPIQRELAELKKGAAVLRLAAPALLGRIRQVYDGPMILLKGAEAGARYPRPELRPSADLDLLIPDAEHVQRLLLDHGFTVFEELAPEAGHHLPQLEWAGLLMPVEIHSRPNWPTWLPAPATAELFDVATTESVVGRGVLALPPAHHALVLTAHMWTDAPIARIGQLLDYWLVSREADPDELARLARRWQLTRLWRTTDSIARSVLLGEPTTVRAAGLWTRRLEATRDRTVLGAKLASLVAPFWGLSAGDAVVATARRFGAELRPGQHETWGGKFSRTAGAVRQSFQPRSLRSRAADLERRRASGR
jgi:putative nucleotidyltransferase-like protein